MFLLWNTIEFMGFSVFVNVECSMFPVLIHSKRQCKQVSESTTSTTIYDDDTLTVSECELVRP